MREQFENLPEIARLIKEHNAVYVQWRYDCSNSVVMGYLNGAYYAFQEQQKKIDSLEKLIDRIYSANEDSEIKSIIDGWDS